MAWIKGKLDDKTNKDELGDEFEALLANAIDNEHDKVIDSYFITVKSLLTSPVISTSITNALVNDFTSHSLLH